MKPPALPRRLLLTGATAAVAAPALAQRSYLPQVVVRSTAPVATPQPMRVVTGVQGGTFVLMGSDLSVVVAEGGLDLRAESSRGSFQNLHDILRTSGVDLGFVATDARAYAQSHAALPNLNRVQYIAKLGTNDLHVVARDPAIQTIQDLAGKRVVIDVEGSGTAITSAAVFAALGVRATLINEIPKRGLTMLQAGDADAVCYAIGKPGALFSGLPQGDVHFVAVPMTDALATDYLPQTFGASDYPALAPEGQHVETVAVGVALACFGWTTAPNEVARYWGLERFVQLFISRFSELQKPPFHPQWQKVSLAATLPGWTRFAPVETALHAAQAGNEAAFDAFLASIGRTSAAGAERGRLRGTFEGLRGR